MAGPQYSIVLYPIVSIYRAWRWTFTSLWVSLKSLAMSYIWRIQCGRQVKFLGETIIRAYEKGAIKIGDNVVFNSCACNNLVGLVGPTILCANKGGEIVIGSQSGFSSVVINARKSVRVGDNVKVGGNVRIFDHDFHPVEWEARRHPEDWQKTRISSVVIEDDVFIGTNAIILKGSHIGARSIVSAGSVVFGLDVPPDSMVKGNPAVVVHYSPTKKN